VVNDSFKVQDCLYDSTDAANDVLIKTTDAIGEGLKKIGGWFS
jgi:hypothetical protein